MFEVVTRKLLAGVALASCMVAAPAAASVIVLDFEGVCDHCAVGDYYNDLGVSFNANTLAMVDSDAGGSGNFANEPTPDTVLFFLNGSAILNYAAGFTDGFSFYYTASSAATVTVWSGLNATGDLLGSIYLPVNFNANGCQGDPTGVYCNWNIGELAFADTARSIDFSGTANYVAFDNITLGSTNPNQPSTPSTPDPTVPEPGMLLLLGIGLVGLGASSQRRRKG